MSWRSSAKAKRRLLREQSSRPVIEQLYLYLLKIQNELLAKSDAGHSCRQQEEGWGQNIIPRPAKDLASQFPKMRGLSPRNLVLYEGPSGSVPEEADLQQIVAKLRAATMSGFSIW